ncbi:MAG: hypothetical protein WDN31_06535 [Hyphomicrobium sp.]
MMLFQVRTSVPTTPMAESLSKVVAKSADVANELLAMRVPPSKMKCELALPPVMPSTVSVPPPSV